jgi:cholesterol transport system auxiliary component
MIPTKVPVANPARSARPLLLAGLVLLCACSVLPKREPTTIYQPSHSAAPVDASTPAANWSLLVDKPVADEWLAADSIAVRPDAGAVQVYQDASWSDSTPNLVQTALLRALEDSQKILSVSRAGSVVRGDYELLTELRSFESVYTQPGRPEAVVEVYAKLVKTGDGSVVAARVFRQSEPASGVAVPAVVDAFSRALDRTTAQVAGWTIAEGNRDAAKH